MNKGRLSVVTPATVWPVEVADVKRDWHVSDGTDDDQIAAHLAAALGWLQPPQGFLGQSIAEQTLRLSLPCWNGEVMLPAGPVSAITSVKYFDTANAEQTVSPSDYWLDDGWLEFNPATFTFPATMDRRGAIRIEYVAGAAATTPEPIKAAVKMIVKEMYDAPGGFVLGQSVAELPSGAQALLAPFKRWW